MRSRLHLCAILCAPLGWHVAVAPALAQKTPPDLLEIRGRVINSVTGEPVAGALVHIPIPSHGAQFSAADGTFVFRGLLPGNYQPFARKPGFFNDEELNSWRVVSAPPARVDRDEQVVLKLTPEAIIYGEVKDENGLALEGVTVRAQRWQVVNGKRQLEVAGNAVSDDEGSFRLGQLRPGRYYFSFLAGGNGWRTFSQLSSKNKPDEGYGTQFYPGVPDMESASVIAIRAGAQVHIKQNLSRQRLFEVSGVVRGADAQSGFNVMLVNATGDAGQSRVRIDPKTGQFQIQGVPRNLLAGCQLEPTPCFGKHSRRHAWYR